MGYNPLLLYDFFVYRWHNICYYTKVVEEMYNQQKGISNEPEKEVVKKNDKFPEETG